MFQNASSRLMKINTNFYRKLVKGKIDKDGDGFVTEQELKDWIKYAQNKYIYEDAEKQVENNDLNKDGFVSWEEYKNNTYGFMDGKDIFS